MFPQAAGAYYIVQNYAAPWLASLLDPDREKNEQAKLKAKANLQRIRRHREQERQSRGDLGPGEDSHVRIEDIELNDYENRVALEVVAPEDIPVGFDAIEAWRTSSRSSRSPSSTH